MFSNSAFPESYANSTSSKTLPEDVPQNEVIIEWGSERMLFRLPDPKTPLLKLKQAIAQKTGIEPQQQTLYMHGFKMKDDSAALDRYGLYEPGDGNPRQQSKKPSSFSNLMRGFTNTWTPKKSAPKHITLVCSPDATANVSDRLPSSTTYAPAKPAQRQPTAESDVIASIQRISTDVLKRLHPDLQRYARQVADGEESGQTYSMLSETLLQALLKLDGIEVNSEFAQARAERKAAVKEVQTVLDKVDALKEESGKA